MECPECQSKGEVLETRRRLTYPKKTYRRYRCSKCTFRWSTTEISSEKYNSLKMMADRLDRVVNALNLQ
jgi:transcriptional regulator NrdR family protein